MEYTKEEKIQLMEILIENLKEEGEGIIVSEKEYSWMIDYLINEGERYEDCALLQKNKDHIIGDVSSTFI